MPPGTVIDGPEQEARPARIAIYVRVSRAEHRANLDMQAEWVSLYCLARGYRIHQLIKEVRY
jgi:predicted site-specific integrase-resolvase